MSDFILGPEYDDPNTSFGLKLALLVDYEDQMSEWEFEFLASMVDMFEKGQNFTDAQIEKVNDLYERYAL